VSAAIFVVILWLGILGIGFSLPAVPSGMTQTQEQTDDLYIAEHPAKFSVWKVHAACMRLKRRATHD